MSFDDGIKAFKEGEYHQAAEYFVNVTELDSQNHKAWNALGICLSKMGDYEQASICFDNALLIAPNNETYERNKTKNKVKVTKKHSSGTDVQISEEEFIHITKESDSTSLTTSLNSEIQPNNNLNNSITQYMEIVHSIDSGKIEKKCLHCGERKGLLAIFSSNKICSGCSKKIDNLKDDLFIKIINSKTNLQNISPNIREFIQLLTPIQQYQVMYGVLKQNPS